MVTSSLWKLKMQEELSESAVLNYYIISYHLAENGSSYNGIFLCSSEGILRNVLLYCNYNCFTKLKRQLLINLS